MNFTKRAKLHYDNTNDLYEGLIIEDDNGVQNQVGHIFPAFGDKYGNLFSAAPDMYEALKTMLRFVKDYGESRHLFSNPENCAHCILIKQGEQALIKAEEGK